VKGLQWVEKQQVQWTRPRASASDGCLWWVGGCWWARATWMVRRGAGKGQPFYGAKRAVFRKVAARYFWRFENMTWSPLHSTPGPDKFSANCSNLERDNVVPGQLAQDSHLTSASDVVTHPRNLQHILEKRGGKPSRQHCPAKPQCWVSELPIVQLSKWGIFDRISTVPSLVDKISAQPPRAQK